MSQLAFRLIAALVVFACGSWSPTLGVSASFVNTALETFGDSLVEGLTGPTWEPPFRTLVAAHEGVANNNFAVGGTKPIDIARAVLEHHVNGNVVMFGMGVNDLNPTSNLSVANWQFDATLAYLLQNPDATKVATTQVSGTWSTLGYYSGLGAPFGIGTTQNGATASFGSGVRTICFLIANPCRITVDGVSLSFTVAPPTPYMYVYELPYSSSTRVVTNSGSGSIYILWTSLFTVAAINPIPDRRVIVVGISRVFPYVWAPNDYTPQLDAMRAYQASKVQAYAASGYKVAYMSYGEQLDDATQMNGLGLHPNTAGNAYIASKINARLDVLDGVAPAPVAPTNTQVCL